MAEATARPLLIVRGSDGHLHIDALTGEVVGIEDDVSDDSNYHQITKFDLVEWREALAASGCSDREGDEIDILHLGYWSEDGSYEAPAHDYREECFQRGREYQLGEGGGAP